MKIATIAALAKALGGGSGGGGGGGSSSGMLLVHSSDADTPVLDKTWAEINNAFTGGQFVVLVWPTGDIGYLSTVPFADAGGDYYSVWFFGNGLAEQYITNTENGYPAFDGGGQ